VVSRGDIGSGMQDRVRMIARARSRVQNRVRDARCFGELLNRYDIVLGRCFFESFRQYFVYMPVDRIPFLLVSTDRIQTRKL
jgi:hypothetical protein